MRGKKNELPVNETELRNDDNSGLEKPVKRKRNKKADDGVYDVPRYKIVMMPIEKLRNNPKNPRVIYDKEFTKLCNSIKEFPKMLFIRPVVCQDDGEILGGNQRFRACEFLEWKLVPCIMAEDLTEDERQRFIIQDNVNAGAWDWDSLANEWDAASLEEWGVSFVNDSSDDTETSAEKLQKYTSKIETPIYECTGEQPSVRELYEVSKATELVKRINVAEIPDDVRKFLILAAYRHVVFDYRNIAEYYAHATKEIQSLFEESALVIIDFKQAIENGYVKLRQEILDAMSDDYDGSGDIASEESEDDDA